MNIFIIPSWHPSPTNPNTGIFFAEQALQYGKWYPDCNLAIMDWGQNDDRYLLWANQPLRSLFKLHGTSFSNKTTALSNNLTAYHYPTYTWSWRFLRGNISNIIANTKKALHNFQAEHGKVDVLHAHVGFPGGYVAAQLSSKSDRTIVISGSIPGIT